MLHYYPGHVSSINMPIFRRTNYIITASSMGKKILWEDSGCLGKALLHVTCRHCPVQNVPPAVCAQFLQSAHHSPVYCSLIFIFSSYLCLDFQAHFSDKAFPSKFCIHFFRPPRPIGNKNC
jgi:hypothetical protein